MSVSIIYTKSVEQLLSYNQQSLAEWFLPASGLMTFFASVL